MATRGRCDLRRQQVVHGRVSGRRRRLHRRHDRLWRHPRGAVPARRALPAGRCERLIRVVVGRCERRRNALRDVPHQHEAIDVAASPLHYTALTQGPATVHCTVSRPVCAPGTGYTTLYCAKNRLHYTSRTGCTTVYCVKTRLHCTALTQGPATLHCTVSRRGHTVLY